MKELINSIFFDNGQMRWAEIYLIIALLVFGIIACFLLPVLGGYDEEHHLMRVWELSSFAFLPNEKLGNDLPFPRVYWDLSYRRQLIVRTVESDFWEKYGSLPLDAYDYIYSIKTRSVFAPPLLFPQALAMRYLGRSLQLPALIVFYACRLIGLFSYILLSWLAVRFIPYGKWVLAILASSPVAILQASTISADTISNGIAFLFIGGSLSIARQKTLRRKDWAFLIFLFFILFLGKINIIPLALLPFLILRRSQFKLRHGYIILLTVTIGLFFIEVVGWNLLAYSRYHDALEGADPLGQVRFILGNLVEFMIIMIGYLRINFIDNIYNWAAIYPFNYWPVPIWTFHLFFIALFITLLIKDDNSEIEVRTRISLIIVFVLAYLGTVISLYLTYTPVGNDGVRGVQGRYFVAIMPLLFLALANFSIPKLIRIPVFLPVLLGGMSLALYVIGMYLSYHVPCGSQYYQPGLCYQPSYKNWDPNDFYSDPVSEQLSITQEIVPECDGMTEIRFWIDASAADPDGMTEFTLMDMDQSRIVASEIIPNPELPSKSWYTMKFPPDWESDGRQYNLEIRGHEKGDTGPRIAYLSSGVYLDGNLYENYKLLMRDIVFQIGCTSGWKNK